MLSPEDCRADVALRDGSVVHLRAVRADDKAALAEEFHRLPPASVRARFFYTKKSLSAEELAYLTEVDFVDHVAVVAERDAAAGRRPVGVARMVRMNEPDHAEVAVTVAESEHGLGIGTALLAQLVRLAPALGVRYLVAYVLAENLDMIDLYRAAGLPLRTSTDAGIRTMTLDLGEA